MKPTRRNTVLLFVLLLCLTTAALAQECQWLNMSSYDAEEMAEIGMPKGIIIYSQDCFSSYKLRDVYDVADRSTWNMPDKFDTLDAALAHPQRHPGCFVVLDFEHCKASYWNYPGVLREGTTNDWTISEESWALMRQGREYLRRVLAFYQAKYPKEIFTLYGAGGTGFSRKLDDRIPDLRRSRAYGNVGLDDDPRMGLNDFIPLSAWTTYMLYDTKFQPHKLRLEKIMLWDRAKNDRPVGAFVWCNRLGAGSVEIPKGTMFQIFKWVDENCEYGLFWDEPMAKIEKRYPDRKLCDHEWYKAWTDYQLLKGMEE